MNIENDIVDLIFCILCIFSILIIFYCIVDFFISFDRVRKLNKKTEYVVVHTYEIESIKNKSLTEGHFSLGFGYIGQNEYLYYYLKNEDDSYQLDKIVFNKNTYIYEIKDLEKAYIEVLRKPYHLFNGEVTYTYLSPVYKVYVPEGTIHLNYYLD